MAGFSGNEPKANMWLISLLLVFQLPCSSWAFLGRTESRQGLDAFYQRMHEDLLNLSEKLLLTDRTSPTLQGRSDSEVDAVNSSAPPIPVSVDGLTFQTRRGSQGKLLASCGQNVGEHPKKVLPSCMPIHALGADPHLRVQVRHCGKVWRG